MIFEIVNRFLITSVGFAVGPLHTGLPRLAVGIPNVSVLIDADV